MSQQQKTLRIFRLIRLLSNKPYRTVKELSQILEVTDDTIYREINLLEEIGYLIDKNERKAYFIFESIAENTATFEIAEMELLNQIIGSIDGSHPLKQSLLQKVYLSSALVPIAEELVDKGIARNIARINEAILANKQIKLIKYHSASSDTIRDRIVEPIRLVKSASQLSAFDVESNTVKHYKIKRITEVQTLDTDCKNSKESYPTDLFGFTSPNGILVKLKLSTTAYQLLIEEFSESRIFIENTNDGSLQPYIFTVEARSFVGIGRFILGLPGEISILIPIGLQEYVNNKRML